MRNLYVATVHGSRTIIRDKTGGAVGVNPEKVLVEADSIMDAANIFKNRHGFEPLAVKRAGWAQENIYRLMVSGAVLGRDDRPK